MMTPQEDINREYSNQELKTFGLIMGGMFAFMFGLVIPLLRWQFGSFSPANWPVWPFIVMAIFWLIAFVVPQILAPVNRLWLKIGNVLGWINTRLIMGIMFYLLFFPIGMLLKLFGKDAMSRKLSKEATTYRKVSTQRDIAHLEKPF